MNNNQLFLLILRVLSTQSASADWVLGPVFIFATSSLFTEQACSRFLALNFPIFLEWLNCDIMCVHKNGKSLQRWSGNSPHYSSCGSSRTSSILLIVCVFTTDERALQNSLNIALEYFFTEYFDFVYQTRILEQEQFKNQ